jgi:septum formation protein
VKLTLASQSRSRHAVLRAAGVPFDACSPDVDEDSLKRGLSQLSAMKIAESLAQEKAKTISVAGLILGCDQTLECEDGTLLDKAGSLAEVADHLRRLSGEIHQLHSAAVIVESGAVVWSKTESATLEMRPLSDQFIAEYVAKEGEELLGCVGGYRMEGLGAQLFTRVEGSHFAILGLPLLPLLAYLRERGVMPS